MWILQRKRWSVPWLMKEYNDLPLNLHTTVCWRKLKSDLKSHLTTSFQLRVYYYSLLSVFISFFHCRWLLSHFSLITWVSLWTSEPFSRFSPVFIQLFLYICRKLWELSNPKCPTAWWNHVEFLQLNVVLAKLCPNCSMMKSWEPYPFRRDYRVVSIYANLLEQKEAFA